MKMDAPRRKIVSDAVDLLTTDYEEQEATVLPANQIVDINTDCIVHYHNHLFHLYEGERLDDLVQSIQDNGVLTPVIVMRLDEENYEMLAGHNRLEAAKLAGLKRIPAIIKEKLSEQEALAYVVETNLRQRSFSDMYPSEQAAVLKVQYSQILSQGRRSDIIRELDALDGGESTSDQIDQRLDSRGRLAKEYNLSPSSIARLIRVFELIEPYKRAMDNKEITMQIAINLSYLSKAAQGWVLDKSEKLGYRLDAKASAEFRSQRNTLSEDGIEMMMIGWLQSKSEAPKFQTIKMDASVFQKYFNREDKPDQVQQTILQALEMYFANASA
jgi:ParB family chromosome partitioning protein